MKKSCLIRDFTLGNIRESIHQMINYHFINHYQKITICSFSFGLCAITNVLYKHSVTAARRKTSFIKSGVKSPTKANTDHYHGVFEWNNKSSSSKPLFIHNNNFCRRMIKVKLASKKWSWSCCLWSCSILLCWDLDRFKHILSSVDFI